jgi:putative membrane protein
MSLPNSAILRAIRGPVVFMTCWAGFLSILHRRLLQTHPVAAELMSIPQVPHSLMVSALSLLLVFKTNSAYQRFAEGRKIWETIINTSRDLYRLMNLYELEMGRSKRRRLQRLLAAFPYLLRHRIRPNLVMYRLDDEENVRNPEHSIVLYQDKAADDLDPEAAAVATKEENEGKSRRKTRPLFWVDKRTLPWRLLPPNALEPCARAQNRPLWVCDRMAQELKNIPDGPYFTARERMALIAKVEKLSGCIGACERIHQTAVPLNYARHSLRALTLWLFTLPFCLVASLKLCTAPALFLVSWLMFGVYEIGYSIEDPFQGTLRLSVLCDTIRRDVLADEVTRSTAFEVPDDEQSSNSNATTQADGTDAPQASHLLDGGDNSIAAEEEERDYESSPVVKPLQVVKMAEATADEVPAEIGSMMTKKNYDGKTPTVEELTTLPVTFNGKTASEVAAQDMDAAILDLMSKKP